MSNRDDRIADAILSESPLERIQYTDRGPLAVPASRGLAIQAILLVFLATVLPLYALFPEGVSAYVPNLDPFEASPKLLIMGFFGFVTQVTAALFLAVLAGFRLRNAPLSESQARAVLDVQRIAAGLSVVTGGLAILVTVATVAVGAAGTGPLEAYLSSVAGSNPFAGIDVGVTVGHLGIVSAVGALAVLVVRHVVVRVHARVG